MIRSCVLIIVSLVGILTACVHQPGRRQGIECGAELSDERILRAAQRWIDLVRPGVKLRDLNPVISRNEGECNYSVILAHGGSEAIEDVIIVVDRRGRVRNIWECCELGDCPDLGICAKTGKSAPPHNHAKGNH